jgi:hypothetical protein
MSPRARGLVALALVATLVVAVAVIVEATGESEGEAQADAVEKFQSALRGEYELAVTTFNSDLDGKAEALDDFRQAIPERPFSLLDEREKPFG